MELISPNGEDIFITKQFRQQDWHKMYDFSNDAILMVLASEKFKAGDYIFEEYDKRI
jgi:hypothetical protein